jgi:hypothetical protein
MVGTARAILPTIKRVKTRAFTHPTNF